MSKQHQTQMEKQYWKGFRDGMINSLKHNINLMKSQLRSQSENREEDDEEPFIFPDEPKWYGRTYNYPKQEVQDK